MKFASKLTALFISIGAIVAAIMYTIAYFQVAKILEGEIRAHMESRVIITMDALDRFLSRSLNDIKIIAGDPVISSGNTTAEQITERLIFFRNTYKWYGSLSFFNLERIRIADTSSMKIGEQNRMTRYWEDVLSGKVSAASDVHISEDFKVPVVYFASTVKNKEGKVVGVVVTRILQSRLFEMIKRSMGNQEEEEEIDIVNKDGLLIYSNHNREGILKENLPEWESIKIDQQEKIFGSAKHRHPDEKEAEIHAFCREQGYLDFKGNGWIIISHVPTRVIFSKVDKLLKILIIMFLAMLPGLVLVIYLFSKTVSRPLVRLSFAAAEIGKGKLDTVIEVKSKDEIGSLANTFNEMAADLKKTTTSIDSLNKEITERKRAEEALRESEERSRSLIETSPDVIVLIDFSGKIIVINEAALTTYGYESRDEVIGRSVLDFVIPEDRPLVLQEISKVLEVKTLRNLEYTSLKKDGSTFPIEVSASLILDGQQKPTSIVIMIRDITGRKRAEEALRESEEQYRSVLDNIEYGYFEVDIAGNFTFFNDSLCRILGYSRDETMGMNNRQYMDKENTQKVYQAFNRVYTTGEPYRSFDWEILRKDGTKRFVESSVSLLRDLKGEGIGFRGIVRDITERKFAEEALRRSEEEAKRLSQENAIMAEIGRIISSTLNIEEVYEPFAEEVKKLIPFDRIVINIINIEKSTVSNVYMAGKGVADRKVGEIYPLEGSGNAEMVRTKSSLLIQTEDFNEYKDRFPMLLSTFQVGFRSIMNVPLFSKGWIIGGLLLRSLKPYAYTDKDVRLAERVGNQIAGAIANAQLFIERKQALEDGEQLILKLQKALTEVKQLSGLLPICASCKKIRDDKGYWGQIESYISDHSEAEFSHGICPDCMKKLYPDFADDKNSV